MPVLPDQPAVLSWTSFAVPGSPPARNRGLFYGAVPKRDLRVHPRKHNSSGNEKQYTYMPENVYSIP